MIGIAERYGAFKGYYVDGPYWFGVRTTANRNVPRLMKAAFI